jgi:hypothetical protein
LIKPLDINVSLYQGIKMRTTVTLDDDVYQAVSTLSRTSGSSLGKILSAVARRGLQSQPAKRRKKYGFPTFDVPADAPMIPGDRIQKFWDEEGLG